MSASKGAVACPKCGAKESGTFCSECGTRLRGGHCARCGAELAAGSRFCAECGAPAGGAQSTGAKTGGPGAVTVPRIVAGLAVVALVVIVAMQAGSRLGQPSGGAAGGGAPMLAGGVAAPNIENMSPRERAARLYDRVMRLHEEGKGDSVGFFAPMALTSYAAITDMDDDARYDMARIAMVAGQLPVARAQADTILRADSTHLLGLLLAADVARAGKDEATAKRLEAKFVASADRERARKLPEYDAHGREIESVLERLKNASKK